MNLKLNNDEVRLLLSVLSRRYTNPNIHSDEDIKRLYNKIWSWNINIRGKDDGFS